MKTVALSLALALGLGFSLPMFANAADVPAKAPTVQAQAPAAPAATRPAAAPAQKIDCAKVENKAHADCKVPAK
jgi:hypothetical protein